MRIRNQAGKLDLSDDLTALIYPIRRAVCIPFRRLRPTLGW